MYFSEGLDDTLLTFEVLFSFFIVFQTKFVEIIKDFFIAVVLFEVPITIKQIKVFIGNGCLKLEKCVQTLGLCCLQHVSFHRYHELKFEEKLKYFIIIIQENLVHFGKKINQS